MKITNALFKFFVLAATLCAWVASAAGPTESLRPPSGQRLSEAGRSRALRIPPQVINTPSRQEVILGRDVEQALRTHDRTFRMLNRGQFDQEVGQWYGNDPNQLPQAIRADFNNDGFPDIAVMGLSQDNKVVVYAVLSTNNPRVYRVEQVQAWPRNDDVNRWRDIGNSRYRITNWPYQLRLAEDEQEQIYGISITEDHLKWESGTGGAQERIFGYSSTGGFRALPPPRRQGRGSRRNSSTPPGVAQ